MRKATIAAMLFALAAWAIPIHAASAQLNKKPKLNSETEIKAPEPYVSQDIVIKDNAIQPHQISNEKSSSNPRPNSLHLVKEPYSGRHYSKSEVQQLIRDYSAQYGIPAEVPLCIARLESGFNQFSKNKSSSASGVFQYLESTWRATDEGKGGYSVFDVDANVRAAIKYMASRKSTSPWVVGPRCPSLK